MSSLLKKFLVFALILFVGFGPILEASAFRGGFRPTFRPTYRPPVNTYRYRQPTRTYRPTTPNYNRNNTFRNNNIRRNPNVQRKNINWSTGRNNISRVKAGTNRTATPKQRIQWNTNKQPVRQRQATGNQKPRVNFNSRPSTPKTTPRIQNAVRTAPKTNTTAAQNRIRPSTKTVQPAPKKPVLSDRQKNILAQRRNNARLKTEEAKKKEQRRITSLRDRKRQIEEKRKKDRQAQNATLAALRRPQVQQPRIHHQGSNKLREARIAEKKRIRELEIQKNDSVIQVTKDGVAFEKSQKYTIPKDYVENVHRRASYGVMENGKFKEKLRIDPATLPGRKGPNYSHYHLNNTGTHYSPRLNDKDPGFRR